MSAVNIRHNSRESLAEQLGSIARNHVNKTYEIYRMLPMKNQKSRGLIIQIKILTQETPEGYGLGVGCCLLRIVPVIAKCLDVTDDLSLNSEDPFERRARTHSAVMIDCKYALSQVEGHLGVKPRAEIVAGDGNCTRESFQASSVFLSLCREAKGAVPQTISETKAVGRGICKILNTHAHFTFRCQKAVNRLRSF